MKKLLLMVAMALTASFGAMAGKTTLLIDGQEVERVPVKITFDGDNAILHFSDGTETHDMESVTLNFSNLSGIEDLSVMQFNGIVGNTILIEGVAPDSTIEIYDTTGRRRLVEKANGTSACMNVASLSNGVYILRAGNDCIKFIKK